MGNLPVNEQLKILSRIWGLRDWDQGYVFLFWIPGHLKTREERKVKGRAKQLRFVWPEDKDRIEEVLELHEKDDLYFCPNLFEYESRTAETIVQNQRVLYADLDEIDPRSIEDNYKPTIAWQTSDGRYQAVWLMDYYGQCLSEAGNENHRLTAYLGADSSGWDATQLLRVPGRKNWKPGKKGQQGVVLWTRGNYYFSPDDFDALPEIEVSEVEDPPDVEEDSEVDRVEAWARVRMRVSQNVRDYMGIRDQDTADDVTSGHTEGASGLMWVVERELADAGCSVAEIIAIIRPMLWNKFAGRSDELVRLRVDAKRAVAAKKDEDVEDDGALEEVEDINFSPIRMTDFLSMPKPHPSWLVKDIWPVSGVGFIAGAPKSYKSWFGLDLAISVATGTPFLGVYEVPRMGKVLYIQEEDSDVEVEDRSMKVYRGKPQSIHPQGYLTSEKGADGVWNVVWHPCEIETLMWLSVRKGLDLTDKTWQGEIANACEEGEYDLVIIDTLGTTIGDADTDKSREVNAALKPLKVISSEHRVAIVVVHHFSKSGSDKEGGRGGRKMLGSVAIHAWAECGLYVGEKTEIRKDVYQVPVERESKRAKDLRFRVEIPHMGSSIENEHGVMVGNVGWSPIVHPGTGGTELGDRAKDNHHVLPKRGKGMDPRINKPAGAAIAIKLVGAAATREERALTPTQIRERLFSDTSPSNIHQQLQKAISNGFVVKTDDGRYYAFKSINN